MRTAHLLELAGLDEQVDRELGDHLQQRDPRFTVRCLAHRHQARVGELRDLVERVVASGEGSHGGEIGRPGQHAEPAEGRPQRRGQQVVAPRDRRPQRLLAHRAAGLARGELEGAAQPGQQGAWPQQLAPRGSELDRQRHPVEAAADLHHVRRRALVEGEAGTHEPRPLHEELHRAGAGRRVVRVLGRVGQLQGRDDVLRLAHQVQRAARRREHGQPGRRGQHVVHHLARGGQLLQVVEHEQHLARRQVLEHRRRGAALARQTEDGRDGRPHHVRGLRRLERDEVDPVREAAVQARRDLHREPGLAAPTGPGQGQQPRAALLQQRGELGDLAVAADDRGGRHGQAARRAEGAQRREVRTGGRRSRAGAAAPAAGCP